MRKTNIFSELLDLSFCVFPLPYGTKKPFQSWKQFQHSKPSVTQCQEWEKTQQNIAIVTGKISNIFVVDIDGENGEQTITDLERLNDKIPDTVMSQTGRGKHLFFQYPEGQTVNNLAGQSAHGEVLAGVDIRGNGGYVVAPPSKHPNGTLYQWMTSPHDTPIAHAPEWLLDMVVKPENTVSLNISTRHCFEDKIQQQCQNIEKATMGILFATVKTAALFKLLDQGVRITDGLIAVWDAETQALFAAVMSFWFGQRALAKFHSNT